MNERWLLFCDANEILIRGYVSDVFPINPCLPLWCWCVRVKWGLFTVDSLLRTICQAMLESGRVPSQKRPMGLECFWGNRTLYSPIPNPTTQDCMICVQVWIVKCARKFKLCDWKNCQIFKRERIVGFVSSVMNSYVYCMLPNMFYLLITEIEYNAYLEKRKIAPITCTC